MLLSYVLVACGIWLLPARVRVDRGLPELAAGNAVLPAASVALTLVLAAAGRRMLDAMKVATHSPHCSWQS